MDIFTPREAILVVDGSENVGFMLRKQNFLFEVRKE
jgi:hypothetical protein